MTGTTKQRRSKAGEAKVVATIAADGSRIGSTSVHFQRELTDQLIGTLWLPKSKTEEKQIQAASAALEALDRIQPRSELEMMLAAQMISTHNAAMECLRRAMWEGQTFEGRDQNLKHAAKLLGIYERQLAALDKHRGKGQQKITVEHVTVEAGGQAIVGNVATPAPAPRRAGKVAPPALTDERSSAALEAARLDGVAKKTERSRDKVRRGDR